MTIVKTITTITLEKKTKTKLESVGKKGQTFDDIVNDLLEKAELQK